MAKKATQTRTDSTTELPAVPDVNALLSRLGDRRAEEQAQKDAARKAAHATAELEKAEARAKRQTDLETARTTYASELTAITSLIGQGVMIVSAEGWQDAPEAVEAAGVIRQHIKAMTDPREDDSEEEKERRSLIAGVMYQDAIAAMNAVSSYEELLETCRMLVFHGNLLTGPALQVLLAENPEKQKDRFTVLGEKFLWPGNPKDLKRAYYGTRDHQDENEGAKDRCGKAVSEELERIRSEGISVKSLLRDANAHGMCVADVHKEWKGGDVSDGVLVLEKTAEEITLVEAHGKIRSFLFDPDTEEKESLIGQSWPHGQLPKKLYDLLLDSTDGESNRGSRREHDGTSTLGERLDPTTQAAMYAHAGVHPDRVTVHEPPRSLDEKEGPRPKSGGRPSPRSRGGAKRLTVDDGDDA